MTTQQRYEHPANATTVSASTCPRFVLRCVSSAPQRELWSLGLGGVDETVADSTRDCVTVLGAKKESRRWPPLCDMPRLISLWQGTPMLSSVGRATACNAGGQRFEMIRVCAGSSSVAAIGDCNPAARLKTDHPLASHIVGASTCPHLLLAFPCSLHSTAVLDDYYCGAVREACRPADDSEQLQVPRMYCVTH